MASSDRRQFVLTVAAVAATTTLSGQSYSEERKRMSEVIEIVRFKLAAGVSAQDFLALDRVVEIQHVAKQPGFLRRESASAAGGEWLVIVHWASAADADASMTSFAAAPAAAAFMRGLDVNSMSMQRFARH